MKRKVLKFKQLQKDAKIPVYDHTDDAGFGIFSTVEKTIKKGDIFAFPTGIASEIPKGYFVSIRDRSSMALKGLRVLGGVIDAGYRGEWHVIMTNLGKTDYKVQKGDKIAQGIFQESRQVTIKIVKKINSSKRGEAGFGSTGK